MRLDLTGDHNIVRVCVRVKDEDRPVKESEIVLCAECDEPIWRSKTQVLRNPNTGEVVVETHCLCPMCNMQHMLLSPEAKLVLPTEGELFALLQELFLEADNDQR